VVSFDPRLLTPPTEEEEIYPYRRAWRSVILENGILLAVVVIVVILFSFIGIRLPSFLTSALSIALALFPVLLWFIFSWWAERFVPRPRERLIAVFLVSALIANAIGIPLVNDFFRVDEWLPLASAVNRIIGHTFTTGIVQEMLKYLVIRYLVWPDFFRDRWDGVAYGATSALGYATVLNLQYVLTTTPTLDTAAIRIFDTIAVQVVCSILVGYGLSELKFSHPIPILPAVTVGLAALINGVALPFRAGLVNAALTQGISTTSPIRALGFSIGIFVAISFLTAFLFNTAERQAREAIADRER
jgi:RsiW-degrading membrane proteinase PrsW (M82 family)